MIYTPATKKAMNICFDNHKDQMDKSGLPYVFHPFHLAEQMQDETTTVVALLHDLIEDTPYTFEQLAEEGFSDEVIEAVRLLTHDDEDMPYEQYILRIKANPIATAVKLADLAHNSDTTRLDTVDAAAKKRLERYTKAKEILLK